MSSSLQSAGALVSQFYQLALSYLPEQAQVILQLPLVKKTLLVVLALGILRHVNRTLNYWSTNNWRKAKPFKGERELVLITGGASGIGKEATLDLARRGIRVIIADVAEPKFTLPSNVFFYKMDVTSPENIKTVAESIRAKHGNPTVLVNNAGVGNDGILLEEPEHKIRQTFEVNIISHFWMTREFLPAMIKEDHGHVVTVASMASFVGIAEMLDYCASKAGALAFHEGLAQELRYYYNAKRVRTSVIHPLWVRTPMIAMLEQAGKNFKQPIMDPEVVSSAIVKQIVNQTSGQVLLPPHLQSASRLRALPAWLQDIIRGQTSSAFTALREWEKTAKPQGK
ncbi:short-chain dehydrogenase/reductase 2 [Paecilomyces variotii No. 5]|uniref:Short-chain dehydrogenase/reductase 3 n=1 Tax=Byssochlamys spectabilis (strain No. 5 / NBRC 109023) TaxID=1356009 RepID=V5FPN9_BYSSN|nr:short-chain dehydrogenase/reductase 2 [Paecilomyces variotii No. 5]